MTSARDGFRAALWAEALKMRRSYILMISALGFALIPLMAGLMMIILKDPVRARTLGLIGTKAQLTVGVADWTTFLGVLTQGEALGGAILFAIVTAWVFGREYADHTLKTLLAIPTPRSVLVVAKLAVIAIWIGVLSLMNYFLGLVIGVSVGLPGWSTQLGVSTFVTSALIALLTFLLMPFVALAASAGRGYLPAVGWAILTVVFAQITAVLGRGDWFPWAVPALVSGMAGPAHDSVGPHSFVLVALTFGVGLVATLRWWSIADQSH